jgi:preprotein translocase subunit SecD
LSFHEVHLSLTAGEAREKGVPVGYRIYPAPDGIPWEKELLLREEPLLHGGDMADAQPSFDPRMNRPIVTFQFNPAGTRKFGLFTRNNVGRQFAIVVDGSVVTAPIITEPILGGKGQISGSFTSDSAAQLAARIRSGTCVEVSRLPAPWVASDGG